VIIDPPFRPAAQRRASLVREAVVPEDRLFVAGRQLAVNADRGGVLDLLLAVTDLDVPGTGDRLVQGHEGEPMPGRQPDRYSRERWLVGGGVNVHGLQFADLVTLGVHYVMTAPLPDIRGLDHASLLSPARESLPGPGARHQPMSQRSYPATLK
jgi:hypothetical protein